MNWIYDPWSWYVAGPLIPTYHLNLKMSYGEEGIR